MNSRMLFIVATALAMAFLCGCVAYVEDVPNGRVVHGAGVGVVFESSPRIDIGLWHHYYVRPIPPAPYPLHFRHHPRFHWK